MKGKPLLQEEEANGVDHGSPHDQRGVTVPGAEAEALQGLGGMICP